MLQSSFFDPVLGIDFHLVVMPAPPTPVPLPLPFVGLVFDPVGLAVGAAIGMAMGGGPGLVLVNSLPVTSCGTGVTNLLTLPHLPVPGVSFARGKPNDDAELLFGSDQVFLGGSRGVRLGDVALSCSDPVRLPTSLVLAIPKGAPVLNRPAMVPDLEGMASGLKQFAGMKALRAASRKGAKLFRAARAAQRRSSSWRKASDALKGAVDRIAPERFRDRLKRGICFLTGHPVDVASGRVVTDNVDFELPGPLPLVFERVYSSSLSWRDGPLGRGWSHSLDQQIWCERGKVVLLDADGREVEFATDHLPDRVLAPGQSVYDPTNQLTLRAQAGFRFEVEEHDGTVREFCPVAGGDPARARLQRIRSRDGHHTIELSHGAGGRLDWARDSCGRLVGFTHDERGRLLEVKLPLASEAGFYRHVRYGFDARGDLVEAKDAAGRAWRFAYQGHLLVQETDRAGLSFYFQYDGVGAGARCVRTWGDGGIYDHVLSYDTRNRRTLVEDSLGNTTLYQMDELGMVVRVTDAHGGVTSYEYDPHTGLLARETDALGNARATTYDERGNAVEMKEPDGATVRVEYDARNLPVRAVDALGGEWTWEYDRWGHLIERRAPDGERSGFGWHKGLLAWAGSPGQSWELTYDEKKRLRSERAPNGGATEYEHDGQGRLVRVKDARGAIERLRWDVMGNLVRVESRARVVQERAYDPEGNLLEARDATRHVKLRYGHFHKVVEREEAGTTLRFDYDREGRLDGVVNEAGERYAFTLDALGDAYQETGFDGATRTYVRDKLGRVAKAYLPSGRAVQYGYDAAGRLLAVKHSQGGGEAEFAYRADGALVRARNESATVVFERDALGRILREVQGDFAVTSRYDSSGARSGVETTLGGRMEILRDSMGEVEFLYLGDDFVRTGSPSISFERDLLGFENARRLPGGVRVAWQHDLAGRPTARRTVRRGAGATVAQLDARDFTWRGEDQIAAIVDARRGETRYQHDARGRLTAQTTPGGTLHRAMDAIGNVYRTPGLTDRSYGKGGKLESSDGARYGYDADGNQVEKVEADDRRFGYRWNGAGFLTEVTRPDGQCVRFEYDAFARRTRKTLVRVAKDGRETVEKDTRFVWDGHALVHEVTAGEEGAGTTTWYFEPETFAPIAKERAGKKWTIASDQLGTPTEMYDELGELAWKMQLDVFGAATTDVATETCPWRWPGQYEDAETGLYYNRFRYYDAQTGRYVSQDPIGLLGGLRLAGSVTDPNVSFDPLGLEPAWVDPNALNFSQRTVADNVDQYTRDMADGKWDWKRSGPLRVIDQGGQLVSYDNRRLLAAQRAGVSLVPIEVLNPEATMPGSKKTWAKAFESRTNDPRNIAAGGAVPRGGLRAQPTVVRRKGGGCA